jgi:hypothetical protein
MEELRNVYKILIGKPERKRPLGRPRCRWKNIKMDLRDIGWEGLSCVHLAQDRYRWQALADTEMKVLVP